jgi:hypothetical protein
VFVSRLPSCNGGDEARGIFGWKLDIGVSGERPSGVGSGAPLARGEGQRSLRTYSAVVLGPRVGFPLRRGTNED